MGTFSSSSLSAMPRDRRLAQIEIPSANDDGEAIDVTARTS